MYPLVILRVSVSQRYMLLLKRLVLTHEGSGIKRIETIQAYTVPPRHSRISTVYKADHNEAITAAKSANDIIVTTSASDREGLIGICSVIAHRSPNQPDKIVARYSVTIRSQDNQNPYSRARGDSNSITLHTQ